MYSQSSASSTGNSQSDRAELVSLMERAVDEVTQSRIIIEQDKQQIADYDLALQKADKLDASNQALVKFLTDEIAKLRQTVADKQAALEAKQKEVDIYKAQLAKEVKKKNFYKRLAEISTVVAVGAIAFIVLNK